MGKCNIISLDKSSYAIWFIVLGSQLLTEKNFLTVITAM